jgi:hypothetical protein
MEEGETIGNLNIPAVLEYRVKTNREQGWSGGAPDQLKLGLTVAD